MKGSTAGALDRLTESLPVRERGLKVEAKAKRGCCVLSLPVRERGLKDRTYGQLG